MLVSFGLKTQRNCAGQLLMFEVVVLGLVVGEGEGTCRSCCFFPEKGRFTVT